MTSRRIYLASSWRNPHYPAVLAFLRNAGHEVYDFRNPGGPHGPKYSGMPDKGFAWRDAGDVSTKEGYRETLRTPVAQAGFRIDFKAMQWADHCVLVLPCGRSAHMELGWFMGRLMPVTVFFPIEVEEFEPELMYLIGDWLNQPVVDGGELYDPRRVLAFTHSELLANINVAHYPRGPMTPERHRSGR